MDSVRYKMDASVVSKASLAAAIGIGKTNASRIVKEAITNFESKVAAEFWLNISGRDFRLVGKTIRIGRAEDNDVVLEHKSCSRYHALLTIAADRIVLEDLKSRNGISVNGSRVKKSELKDNDEVCIGDLEGVFFQRVKNQPRTSKIAAAPKALFDRLFKRNAAASQALDSFQKMDAKKKKVVIALGIVLLAGAWILLSGPSSVQEAKNTSAISDSAAAELKPSDRRSFERCLEAEDLGNFRQASACFKNLAQTPDVQTAVQRVQKHQAEFSEQRWKEGVQAFENYYYDIAILKWQEVLLVSDDSSEYRLQAIAAIQKAEEKKKQR